MLALKTDTNPGNAQWLPEGDSGLRTQFIWRPAGVEDPSNGIYTTWDTVHAAAAASGTQSKVIYVDSPGAPAVITAGNFDMTGIHLAGLLLLTGDAADAPTVNTSDGTVFTNWALGASFLIFQHLGNAPLYTLTDALSLIRTGPSVSMLALSDEIYEVNPAGGSVQLTLLRAAVISSVGGFEPISVSAGNTVEVIIAEEDARLQDDTVRGAGDLNLAHNALGQGFADGRTQTNLAGVLTTTVGRLTYIPTNLADWNNDDPLDVANALDRIAALVGPVT